MIPVSGSQDEKWDSFENAATLSAVRSLVKKREDRTSNYGNDMSRKPRMTNKYYQNNVESG